MRTQKCLNKISKVNIVYSIECIRKILCPSRTVATQNDLMRTKANILRNIYTISIR